MIIKQLNYKKYIQLEIKCGFLGPIIFHGLMNYGFKYNKFDKSLSKRYYYKAEGGMEYLEDCYQRDIDYLKGIEEYYDHYIFDLLKHNTNIKR